MDKEIGNARAAWDWAVARGLVGRLDQGMDGLCRFYAARGRYQEGERAYQAVADKLAGEKLTTTEQEPPAGDRLRIWAKALVWQSVFHLILGHNERTEQLLQQSQAFLDSPALTNQDIRPEKAALLMQQGLLVFRSDMEKTRQSYEQGLALYRELGDPWQTANALAALGGLAWLSSAYDKAKQWHEEGLAIRQILGDQGGIANSLGMLSIIALDQRQFDEAERLIQKSVAIRRELRNPAAIAVGLGDFGGTLLWLGKFDEAYTLLEECLAIYRELGFRLGEAHYSAMLGRAEAHWASTRKRTPRPRRATVFPKKSATGGEWPLPSLRKEAQRWQGKRTLRRGSCCRRALQFTRRLADWMS